MKKYSELYAKNLLLLSCNCKCDRCNNHTCKYRKKAILIKEEYINAHTLIPSNIKIPNLYETEKMPLEEKEIKIKLFDPYGSFTWYIVEYSPQHKLAFGYLDGIDKEWGYISIPELESLMFMKMPRIERDLSFNTCKIANIIRRAIC